MFKLLFGFILGCLITYNFIMPYPEREKMLADASKMTLHLLQTLQDQLENNDRH